MSLEFFLGVDESAIYKYQEFSLEIPESALLKKEYVVILIVKKSF